MVASLLLSMWLKHTVFINLAQICSYFNVVQFLVLLLSLHSSKVPALTQSSGYCLCGTSRFLSVSM